MNFTIIIPSMIIGFLFMNYFSGAQSGEPGRFKFLPSIKLPLNKHYIFHLHHWLYSLIALLILLSQQYYNDFIWGLLIGFVIQGLTYVDFYKIINKKINLK